MPESQKITNIQIQGKRKDRYSIFINEKFAFGLYQDVLIQSGIAQGDILSQEQINSLKELENKRAAKEKAMRLLAVRARSIKEISDRLSQAGFSKNIVNKTIKDLKKLKLLDDLEFAKMFARSRMITKPEGRYLLHHELEQKGLSDLEIEEALAAAYEEKSEYDVAMELAKKSKKKYIKLDLEKAKKRVTDFLARRGFHWELVNDIIENWDYL